MSEEICRGVVVSSELETKPEKFKPVLDRQVWMFVEYPYPFGYTPCGIAPPPLPLDFVTYRDVRSHAVLDAGGPGVGGAGAVRLSVPSPGVIVGGGCPGGPNF